MRSEANILNDCRIDLSQAGCKAFRNNTGVLKGANGQPVRFGLAVGSGDIIGIAPDGIFYSVEVKTEKGRPTPKQLNWIDMVNAGGGRAGIARNAKEAVDIALGVV